MSHILKNKTTTILTCLLLVLMACENKPAEKKQAHDYQPANPPLFTLLSSGETGIDFQNTLTEGLNTNILMYEYFYNGGGVATGDLNGDGLIDIYFSANMSDNKLYLNQGELKFKDATALSKAGGREGPWKTGVTMADVDGDDKLDIYLSYSGALPNPKRANQLFINQGNDANNIPVFKDEAEKWGINSPAFSNQAYFFDYDRDGDLDMLLLNHNPKSLPVLNEANTKVFMAQDDPFKGVRLFEQKNQTFVDVTQKAGIIGSGLSYGLGIGITDINQDGWADFYVSNDYTIPDYLYINNGNGTFTNKLQESIGHNSHFSMGNDVADYNNDGWTDIFTLDMLPEDNHRQKILMTPDNYAKFDLNLRSGFHYQYMRNMLQKNNGDGTFSEIGQLAGVANTDWSWAALLADYDNDGWKDLFISNGYYRDYTNLDFIKYMNDFTKAKGRLQREDVLEIINHMPASDVKNYIFANEAGKEFSNQTQNWGFSQNANSNGAAYADLDNDGDLDLVVNNINQYAFVYRNDADQRNNHHYLKVSLKGDKLNTHGIGARVTISYQGKKQSLEQYNSRGYLSAVSPVLHFGLGDVSSIDSLTVNWVDGKVQVLTNIQANQEVLLKEIDARAKKGSTKRKTTLFSEINPPVDFINPELRVNDFDRQLLLINEFSYSGPCMAKADVNGDGLEDLFVGGAVGQSAGLFTQNSRGGFNAKSQPAFETDAGMEDGDAIFFDANQDGHIDLYIASGGYHLFKFNDPRLQDRLYLNDGKGNFSKTNLPEMLTSSNAVAIDDVNGDQFPDVFIGGRVMPGKYPEAPRSYVLVNDGKGNFTDQTQNIAPDLAKLGMITDAVWTDLNIDNQPELVIVGEWLPISVYSLENGTLVNKTSDFIGKEYKGWWNTIAVADLNGDQKPDLIAGNTGVNTQFKIRDQEPAELFYKDFDKNGSIDPLFCFYIQGQSYPYVTRDELLYQLSGFRSRFNSYQSYADARINDLFSKEELEQAGYLSANHMKTTLFLSNAEGKLAETELPQEAQYAPIYTINIFDADQDGNQDLLLCGNNSHAKLRLGKFDANYGVLLRGNGNGDFTYVNQRKSGFQLKGDVKSAIEINGSFIFGINEGRVVAYRRNK